MKKQIKIANELPLNGIGELSQTLNDFDFCKADYVRQFPAYREYFIEAGKTDREFIVCPGVCGYTTDTEQYAELIRDLKPTAYVVQDFRSCAASTNIKAFEDWLVKYPDLPGLSVGVVHGIDYQDKVDCYKFMAAFADIVAIPVRDSYFFSIGAGINSHQRMSMGRTKFLRELMFDGFYDPEVPIHLLGCCLPLEFLNYRDIDINIISLSTSTAVIHAVDGIEFGDYGISEKTSTRMNEIVDIPLTDIMIDLLKRNARVLRGFVQA